MLLLVTESEVQSFWLLDSLIGDKVPSSMPVCLSTVYRALIIYHLGYYTAGMTGLEVDHFVLQTLLQSVDAILVRSRFVSVTCCCACRKRTPRLIERLKQLKIDIQVLTSRWFICLFVDALPVEVRGWAVSQTDRQTDTHSLILFRLYFEFGIVSSLKATKSFSV